MSPAALLGMRFLCAFAILAIAPYVFLDLQVQLGWLSSTANAASSIEASMLAWLLTCALVVAFAWWQPPGLPWRPVRARSVVIAYLPFVFAWIAVLLAYLFVAREWGLEVPAQRELRQLAAGTLPTASCWLVVLGVTVAAPVAEELVFRGYLQNALLGGVSPRVAIAISAVVFGAVHQLPYAVPVGLLGAFFGWLAVRHGSLWPAVIAHALHNTTTVVVTVLWPQSLDLLYPR